MLNIYFLRHGQTAWNADNNRYCGRTDIGLNAKGLEQAGAVALQLKHIEFDGVYSSPLQRAFRTAEIASGKKVIAEQRLIEGDFGEWENKTREEFIAENPKSWDDWCADPGVTKAGVTGETALEIVTRVNDFFQELLATRKSGNFLVVAHNGVNRLYMAYKLGMPLRNYRQLVQLNSAISMFSLDKDGTFTLHYLNSML